MGGKAHLSISTANTKTENPITIPQNKKALLSESRAFLLDARLSV